MADVEQPPKKTWRRKCISFLGSYVGLFVLLGLYTVGGAYIFYIRESNFEQENYEKLMEDHKALNESSNYLAEYLSDLHYSDLRTINNCTELKSDPCYKDVRIDGYFSACGSSDCYESEFCKCIVQFRKNFEDSALASLRKYIEHIVRVASSHNYVLDKEGQVVWEPTWTFSNAFLFAMTTLTLIGYGHIAPSDQSGQLGCVLFIIIGLPIMMIFLANIGGAMARFLKYSYSRLCCRWCRVRRKHSEKRGSPEDAIIDISLKQDEVGDEEYMPTDTVAVPIMVTLCVMTVYIVFGAAVYTNWEGWSFLSSIYFCFVTLTTLGFGDLVPGQQFSAGESKTIQVLELIFTAIYCLIGLALISMGISLMQEQVMAKADWLAGEVGMKETEEDRIYRYIVTKFPDAKFTPDGKGGLKLDFGKNAATKVEAIKEENEESDKSSDDDSDDTSTSDSSSNYDDISKTSNDDSDSD